MTEPNFYKAPTSSLGPSPLEQGIDYEYVGFWTRALANIIDSLLILLIIVLLLIPFADSETGEIPLLILLENSLSGLLFDLTMAIVIIVFWVYYSATPGKMIFSAKIVDASTGGKPTMRQYVIRYLGYIISVIPFGLGIIWVAFDPKKQGWHDKLANTLVIRYKEYNLLV